MFFFLVDVYNAVLTTGVILMYIMLDDIRGHAFN